MPPVEAMALIAGRRETSCKFGVTYSLLKWRVMLVTSSKHALWNFGDGGVTFVRRGPYSLDKFQNQPKIEKF